MNLTNSSEIQLGEETNWNCCVCWWRGGERGRRWVDRRGKEDRPPLLHPTPPNASPALVESPALPAGEAAAAGTKSILGLRDSAAACEPAPALWAPTWGWHGAEEPITRSPLNRLKANAELVRTAFFWKLLVEDLGQSGWLSNKKPISRNSCLSPPAQAFDNNFLFKSLITCVHL